MSDSDLANAHHPVTSRSPAGPLRRLGAIIYDMLLVIAVLIAATVPFIPFLQGRVLVPREVGALAYLYWLWELLIAVLFFGLFWTRKGQTLGMQAWRLRIETLSGTKPKWGDAVSRLLWAIAPWLPGLIVIAIAEQTALRTTLLPVGTALLGLGLINYGVAWFDPARRSWHDRFLKTRIIHM